MSAFPVGLKAGLWAWLCPWLWPVLRERRRHIKAQRWVQIEAEKAETRRFEEQNQAILAKMERERSEREWQDEQGRRRAAENGTRTAWADRTDARWWSGTL